MLQKLFKLLLISPLFFTFVAYSQCNLQDFNRQFAQLQATLKKENAQVNEYFHNLEKIKDFSIFLKDGSQWKISSSYKETISQWIPGDRLKISKHSNFYINNIRFENVDQGTIAWGVFELFSSKATYLSRIISSKFIKLPYIQLVLNDQSRFKGNPINWKIRDKIFVFHKEQKNQHLLWNLTLNQFDENWIYLGNNELESEDIFYLDRSLAKKVLGQKQAIQIVTNSILNYLAGLSDQNLPIGVFLFLGPTGVGKTELAKSLTALLYNHPRHFIRFDMSHFMEPHSSARLIGSPPGYVNHEEGGQLTKAIQAEPSAIVLLDEIEKADPAVRKVFLPVFDEGYITDNKNHKVLCNKVIFIMTSNLCSREITELFYQGFTVEEILQCIEPKLIEALSPEFYNRVTPVLFQPLTLDLMGSLVDKMINEFSVRLKKIKKIDLIIEESVRNYLIKEGFHPHLGARFLKKLIEKKVISFLSYMIIKESIPEESKIFLSYEPNGDEWILQWESL